VGNALSSILTFQDLRLALLTTSFNIQNFCLLPTVHLGVMRGSHKKNSDDFSIQN